MLCRDACVTTCDLDKIDAKRLLLTYPSTTTTPRQGVDLTSLSQSYQAPPPLSLARPPPPLPLVFLSLPLDTVII